MKKVRIALLAAMLLVVAFSTAAVADQVTCTHSSTTVIAQYPSCTATGQDDVVCSDCGTVVSTTTIAALGHNMYESDTVDATCTTNGQVTKTCANPGCTYTEVTAIPATGHCMVHTEDYVAPTCTEVGAFVDKCTNPGCSYVEAGAIPATGHSWCFVRVYQDDTCTGIGLQVEKCTVCEEYRTVEFNNILDHNWVTANSVAPTCTETGVQTDVCSICAAENTMVLPALGHDWSAWSHDENPTCEQDGLRSRYCLRACCYDPYLQSATKETEVIAAHGHLVDEQYTTVIEPTETTDGSITGICVYCSKTVVETIPAIGIPEYEQNGNNNNDNSNNNNNNNNGSKPITNEDGFVIPGTGDNTSVVPFVMVMVAFFGLTVLAATKKKVHG